MRNCTNCKYAEWDKTANGRLHPSGQGRCRFPYKVPQLPQSMYWIGGLQTPSGGFINRKDELKDHCVYYTHA